MFGRKGLSVTGGEILQLELDETERLAAKIQADADSCHPLVLAAKMAGFMAPPPHPSAPKHIEVFDIDHPTICQAGEGNAVVEGLSLRLFHEQGDAGVAYLYPEFAAVWSKTEGRPRARIPAEILRKYVPQYTQSVLAVMNKIRPPLDIGAKRQREWIDQQLNQTRG